MELKSAIRLTYAAIDDDLLNSAVMGVVIRLTCLLSCDDGNVEHLLSILIKESFYVCVCSRYYGLPMARRALKCFS